MSLKIPAFAYLILVTLLYGCRSIDVRPEVPAQQIGNFRLSTKIIFDGNREYLPRILQDAPASASNISVEYQYDMNYKNTDIDTVALFNPLSIVGFPSGINYLNISAELKILRKGELVKGYRAICAIDQHTGLWSFRTVTDMRRAGLIALRDNIESQLVQDKIFIEMIVQSQ